jgi:hypothetical protein
MATVSVDDVVVMTGNFDDFYPGVMADGITI